MELDYKRIVVTFLMHLGDVILTTPFLEVLRKAAPHSHITYVIDEKLQQVMQYNPNIDELIVVDKKGICLPAQNHLWQPSYQTLYTAPKACLPPGTAAEGHVP